MHYIYLLNHGFGYNLDVDAALKKTLLNARINKIIKLIIAVHLRVPGIGSPYLRIQVLKLHKIAGINIKKLYGVMP